MKNPPLKIANAQAFWGDRSDAALELVTANPDLDYITFDYLAEISLSIMAIQRAKDPALGYAKDFVTVVKSLIPYWKAGGKAKLISNAGGLNPKGCAEACYKVLQAEGCQNITIGYSQGDDVLSQLKKDPSNSNYYQLDRPESLENIVDRLVSANAYVGAGSIVEALELGARIVITGRVADPSLTVAPCIFHYKWKWDDYNLLAGATIAGHLIECGAQVCGGISTHWLEYANYREFIGFPIVEIDSNGSCIITKAAHSGGVVNLETVTEQLVYEIGDPENYLSPDVRVSFLSLKISQTGKDRVLIEGAQGFKPPETLKVSACYQEGFRAEGTLAFFGSEAIQKAYFCSEIVKNRLSHKNLLPSRFHVDVLGGGVVVPGIGKAKEELKETILRLAAADQDINKVEAFSKEFAPLVTSGPQGTTGYTSGRPQVKPIYSYWPCLISRHLISMQTALLKDAAQ